MQGDLEALHAANMQEFETRKAKTQAFRKTLTATLRNQPRASLGNGYAIREALELVGLALFLMGEWTKKHDLHVERVATCVGAITIALVMTAYSLFPMPKINQQQVNHLPIYKGE